MVDVLGYAASIAVLATFLMQTMLPLRFVAILSNILFLLYGYYAHIPPVLFLHATLLPINVVRLNACAKSLRLSSFLRGCLASLAQYSSARRTLRSTDCIRQKRSVK